MTEIVTLDEAKLYLRVDSSDEDGTVEALLSASEKLCTDVARLTWREWEAVLSAGDGEAVTIRGEECAGAEAERIRELMKTAVLFALGYLFEHREEADHRALVMTLRGLLSSVREGVF